jgi:hypothetical protein
MRAPVFFIYRVATGLYGLLKKLRFTSFLFAQELIFHCLWQLFLSYSINALINERTTL